MRSSRLAAVLTTVALVAPASVLTASPAVAAPASRDGCVSSRPEPGSDQRVRICYTLFKPAGASRRAKAPVVLHSHGWGGSRTTDAAEFEDYLDAGIGVLSFDQRGFGDSGGKAHVMNPAYEGRDVRRLVRFVAQRPWVRKDAPGDPRLGAIGGSYGGGYQFLAAFEHLRTKGTPVLDALAPEITWWDLKQSLAPSELVRTEWVAALSAAGLPSDALPTGVYVSLLEGAAAGTWPQGAVPGGADLDRFFLRNGPKWQVSQGRRLDIPVLFGQGATDNLFPLRQGLQNWQKALTDRARRKSIFVGYNGGHTLPSLFPLGVQVSADPCSQRLGSEEFGDLALRFMEENLQGKDRGLRGFDRFHLATNDDRCVTTRSVRPDARFDVADFTVPTVAGPPVSTRIARGPITVAGRSRLAADVTTLARGNRAFLALAVGRTPLDARIVQNNSLPVRIDRVVSDKRVRVELPSVAVKVPKGQSLFLLASPLADMFAGFGSRTPSVMQFSDVRVALATR
ncbi:CocE/NonD family hydrolase [Nocardioidaceae bacterium]|nr:CocE/NonD family hydrolase [Nocardioidaceae bacterium]